MKTKLWGLMLAAAAAVTPAWAADMKVAIFDANVVMNSTNASKRAATRLEARVNEAQKKIADLEKPLVAKQQQLREQQSVMAPDRAKQAQEEFAKELGEFRKKASAIQEELEVENSKLRKQLAEGVRKVVADLAKEREIDLILPKGMVFHASAEVPDLTDEVLKRANALLDK